METLDRSQANVTFFLDRGKQSGSHFLLTQTQDPVIQVQEGSEAGAFIRLIDHIASMPLHPDTIVYIVEDDYLHRPGWIQILREGFTLPVDYVTLYDHRDKYFLPIYRNLKAQLFTTLNCHWRITPSTTNTFAVRFQTLQEDLRIHHKFSKNRPITDDHKKFCYLKRKGRVLISPMPGWSTHAAEPENISPCIDWGQFLKE